MKSRGMLPVVVVLMGGLLGCDSGPRSPVGFRLPAGDIQAGKTAFLELGCYGCHEVAGVDDLPAPDVHPPVSVRLGGRVFEVRTDGYLVTSIIHPSHQLARDVPAEMAVDEQGRSRMKNYHTVMTVGQLVDLVAFLQSRYQVVAPPQPIL